MHLEIILEDDDIIAINKLSGLLVHRTALAASEKKEFAVQILRDQIGQRVYPAHRLDRPTSGILLFSKKEEVLPLLKKQFENKTVHKSYLAIVRGIPAEKTFTVDQGLKNERSGKIQDAVTHFQVLDSSEIPYDTTGRYPTSRYSLLLAKPETGRTHQIRRHLAHKRHYILGDKKHGNNKQNSFFEKQFGLQNLLLHAHKLEFNHPISNEKITLKAEIPVHFRTILKDLNLSDQVL
ncbi:MAG TPA: pseudouridylate synthase [Algoriphagus sp.]|jgi:tRNA pseudouridine65 synthase|uniref:pseudouridine synthase n=1 Tax=unclassified Algoriphagus TaxID=2641541 RepID=UPI000C468E87|nr:MULTISPECIES: pseudouridine synthase [unclassified Algoriphagus]MAL11934.1 pseudouridylate synthase [Algoriphagus sp.]QYH38648.1 pseudouridylate synthase [Algoriphagus sp. NBT04N3]HAH35677.1 pseudouridylate synthase [Algoriphagus sp.]HAS57762.1 pseudouridylate synthase [Algoriphagus sp.]HCD87023.1 pseudouridylate synthase [Algoriphagus sp.]|tara:strand:+ start:3446 stop:4153 length:708 start_codon:yes stop_codon:yes gene_type:complete